MKATATEYNPFRSCLPPEAYIRLLNHHPQSKVCLTRRVINHILHTLRK